MNAVTHVIGLDPVVTEAVTSLKRILLSQVITVTFLFVFDLLVYCVCIQCGYFISFLRKFSETFSSLFDHFREEKFT